MAKIGYIRVSTNDQNSDLQRNALISINCERIFEDKISGKTANRPGLKRALKQLKKRRYFSRLEIGSTRA